MKQKSKVFYTLRSLIIVLLLSATIACNNSTTIPTEANSGNTSEIVRADTTENSSSTTTVNSGDTSTDNMEKTIFPKPFENGYFTGLDKAEVLSEAFGVTFSSNSEAVFLSPYDTNINRSILVENTGTDTILIDWKISSDSLGLNSDALMTHPQPGYLVLQPNDTQVIETCYQYHPNNVKSGDASFNVNIKVTNKNDISQVRDINFILKNTVIAYSQDNQQPANASISGIITDSETKKPLQDVVVYITDGVFKQPTMTDAFGHYSFSIFAYKNARGFLNQYAITVNQNQGSLMYDTGSVPNSNSNPNDKYSAYGQVRSVISPSIGDQLTMDFQLEKKAAALQYSVDKIIDTGVQQYAFDATEDGSVIASIPFHTGFSDSERGEYAYLHVFNYKGDVLFDAYIGDETPAIDVSKDGSLIATTMKNNASDSFSYAVVFDNQGNKCYQSDLIEYKTLRGDQEKAKIWEVQISDDNKYLMMGDVNGTIWMVELSTGKIVWSASTGSGQVRKIKFDLKDTVIYVSSGDGYLRCYTTGGTLKWMTYVDAWLPDMEISSHYIVTMSKASPCYIHILDRLTGETIQTIPVSSGGSHIAISPDESLLWYGNSIAGGTSALSSNIYDLYGNIKYNFCSSGFEVVFSADSQYFAAKNGTAVAVLNREGQILWQQALAKDGTGDSISTVLWMSPDGKYLVAGMNNDPGSRFWGQLYFLSRK